MHQEKKPGKYLCKWMSNRTYSTLNSILGKNLQSIILYKMPYQKIEMPV